jgi:hypothetical protein
MEQHSPHVTQDHAFLPPADIDRAVKFPANRRERQRCGTLKKPSIPLSQKNPDWIPLDPDSRFPVLVNTHRAVAGIV